MQPLKEANGGDFADIFKNVTELPEFLELALEKAQEIFSPNQASIYLKREKGNLFNLEVCCGSSPLDLADQFSALGRKTVQPPLDQNAEIQAGQTGQMIQKAMLTSGTEWFRNALPLTVGDSQNQGTLGIMVLDFPKRPELNPQAIKNLIDPLAKSLSEILNLEKLRQNEYELLRNLSEPTHQNTRMDVLLAEALARELGLGRREVEELKIATYLRDVGYRKFKEDFMQKEGPLTEDEWREMKKHPLYAIEKLCELSIPQSIQAIVRHHHESYNGEGYPDGLANGDIELGARILAVVDSYGALTSKRPYREAFERRKALEVLGELSGKKYDPQVVSSLAFGDHSLFV